MSVGDIEVGLISRECPHCDGYIVGIDMRGELTEQHLSPEELGLR